MDYTSIKVGQLPTGEISGGNFIPHEVAGILKKATITDLAAFIGANDAVGFRAVSVQNGGTLPATDTQEFILVGPGTYNNVGGGSTITVTEELNALVSNGTFWFVGVEIPIDAPPGNAIWGQIIGTLSNQTDLKNILDLKADLVDGKVPASQLPSYVDDIIEVANYAALPTTGETGKIYLTLDNNKIYRWSGSIYIEIAAENAVWGQIVGTLSNQTDLQNALNAKEDDIAAGTTAQYWRGDKSWQTLNKAAVGLGNVDNTTDLNKPISTATQTALNGKFNNPTGDTTQYIAGDGSLITFPVAGQAGTLVREVRNVSGATITKGTVVYINGASGNKPTIAKALATGDSTSAQTFGLLQADIPNNSNGYVVCIGDLIGINTSGISVGTQLYLSATTAGEYTTTKQLAPNHLVYIGVVTRSHASLGQIEVKIQNGYELDELHDVAISSKANNEVLVYESSSDLWKNKSIPTILGYTPANDSAVVKLTGDQTIAGLKTFSSKINAPIFELQPNNTIGNIDNYIGQVMASNDWWKIYGNTIATDRGEMVFELGDNAQASSSVGQRFRFFYNNASDGTAKSAFILDYNDATFNTNAYFTGSLTAVDNIQTDGLANKYLKSTGFISNQLGRLSDFGASDSGYYVISGGGIQFVSGGANRITLNSSGNLGINTTIPDAIFTINKTNSNFTSANEGHILLDNSSASGQTSIYYRINGTVRAKLRADVEGSMNFIANGGSHEFWTGGDAGTGSVKMRINSVGNVLIGTTTVTDNSGLTITPVNGATFAQLAIVGNNASGSNASLYFEAPGQNGCGMFYDRNAGLLRVWSGTTTNGVSLAQFGTSWSSYSDIRLKTDLLPIENALNKIENLRSYTGRYITDDEGKSRSFLIAQDVLEVFPEAVSKSEDEMGTLSLSYTELIPVLVKAIQELKSEIDLLKAK
jgi:hypothetical protein